MASDIKASIITGGVNNHPTTSEEANAIATDFIPAGVVGAITNTAGVSPATGSYAVNQSGTPAMTVDISAGIAYTLGTPTGQSSQSIRSKMAATYTAYPINANTSGSTKYDWIYLKFDPTKAAAPNVDATDVINLYTSRSTSNTSDDGTPPTYGTLLAVVTVANSASSIVNANITDKRTQVLFSSAPADNSVTTTKIANNAVTAAKIEAQQAWQAPTLLNNWVNYDTNTFSAAGYMKDSLGFTHIQGLVKSGTVGTTVFTLPAGYRPLKGHSFVQNSNSALGTMNITSDGNVTVIAGSNVFFYLDCSFRAEQ